MHLQLLMVTNTYRNVCRGKLQSRGELHQSNILAVTDASRRFDNVLCAYPTVGFTYQLYLFIHERFTENLTRRPIMISKIDSVQLYWKRCIWVSDSWTQLDPMQYDLTLNFFDHKLKKLKARLEIRSVSVFRHRVSYKFISSSSPSPIYHCISHC